MKTDRGVLDRTSYSGNSRAHEDCHGLFGEEAPQGPGRDSHCFGDILGVAPVLGVHQEGPEVVLAVVPRLPAPKQRNEQGMDLPKASTPAQKPPCPLPRPICPSLLKLTCHFIISTVVVILNARPFSTQSRPLPALRNRGLQFIMYGCSLVPILMCTNVCPAFFFT